MAIVPIRDDYTDTSPAGVAVTVHTPILIGSNKALLLSNKGPASPALGSNAFAEAPEIGIPADGGQYVSLMTDNSTYDLEAGEPGTHWKSAWWKYVPATSGTASIDTQLSLGLASTGGSRDTVLFVYTGSALNNLVEVGQDDDAGGGGTSRIASLGVTAGTTYYIRVVSWTVNFGINLTLRVVGPRTTFGAVARVYTTSGTGWTRGNAVQLATNATVSRASAATLDGNVLTQGVVDAHVIATVPATTALGFAYGTSTPEIATIASGTSAVPMAQLVRFNAGATITSVTFNVANESGGSTHNARISLCTSPLGTGVLGTTGNLAVGAGANTATIALHATVTAAADYYLVFASADGLFNTARLGATLATEHYGPLDPTFTAARYINGASADNTNAIWFRLAYETAPAHTDTTVEAATGYTVLSVAGDAVVAGLPLAISGATVAALGVSVTAPDAMARIPLTNQFWAWRNHPDVGSINIDLLQVTGASVKAIGTAAVITALNAYTPHAIVPISATEAISLLSFTDRLKLVHLVIDGTGTITASLQDIVGYPASDGATLVPGLKYQAELLVPSGFSDVLQLIRLGIGWNGSGFNITALPVTQLASVIKPPDYTPRTKSAAVAVLVGSSQAASGGTHITARRYVSDGSDDNWLLLTEYDQDGGAIICNTWAKGDLNGDVHDQLSLNTIALRMSTTSDLLVVGGVESYLPAGADSADRSGSPRLGIYRRSYLLDAFGRSQRESFER